MNPGNEQPSFNPSISVASVPGDAFLPEVGGLLVFMNAPAFQFYASDFIASTATMTAEEVGAYIRLLCYQWINGGIPNDDDRIKALVGICGGNAMAYAKSKLTVCDDGMLRHPRLEDVRSKQDAFRKKQAENASKRWVGNPTALPLDMPNSCSPSPSPSPKKKRNTFDPFSLVPDCIRTDEFLEAWLSFVDHRSEIKKPLTERAAKILLKKLEKMTVREAISAIETSISAGYTNIYEPRKFTNGVEVKPKTPDSEYRF